jgi:O-acetyl-ADP-ribose deacetylase (regulator of RNase III)
MIDGRGQASNMKILEVDITKLSVDAVVNAANTALAGGGGVDGAIHHAAGPELLEECLKLGGCETGDVKVTSGYKLAAKYIFHAVGPVWRSGKRGEAEKLRSCYRRSMEIANEFGIQSIAFPAISCGAFGYPLEEAAEIAVSTVGEMLDRSSVKLVIFALVDSDVAETYRAVLRKRKSGI